MQNREIEYVEIGGGMNFADDMHLDATFNYSIGHYAQTTAQDTFGTARDVCRLNSANAIGLQLQSGRADRADLHAEQSCGVHESGQLQ